MEIHKNNIIFFFLLSFQIIIKNIIINHQICAKIGKLKNMLLKLYNSYKCTTNFDMFSVVPWNF